MWHRIYSLTEGTVDGDDLFVHFVEQSLFNILQPFDGNNPRSIVVMTRTSKIKDNIMYVVENG